MEWKAALRAEPQIARLVLRRLVGPLTLHTEKPAWLNEQRWVKWQATPKVELLDGLATFPHGTSPTGAGVMCTAETDPHLALRDDFEAFVRWVRHAA